MTQTQDEARSVEALVSEVKAAAEAATPGPWSNTPARSTGHKSPMPDFHEARVHVGPKENFGNSIAIVCMGGSGATSCSADDVSANAAYIALANPANVLILTTEIERLKTVAHGVRENIPMAYLQANDVPGATGPTDAIDLVKSMRKYAEARWRIIERCKEAEAKLVESEAREGALREALKGIAERDMGPSSLIARAALTLKGRC